MRSLRYECFSPNMNNLNPEKLKKYKAWWLISTANPTKLVQISKEDQIDCAD